ncbi:hypothetical protein AKO1_007024 [Acrasis kona]|uniref:Uncharacterized protein n=1 Tax=Acrasis kona TaxID=1008807 RepID=A0AAW2YUV1_9EUKA
MGIGTVGGSGGIHHKIKILIPSVDSIVSTFSKTAAISSEKILFMWGNNKNGRKELSETLSKPTITTDLINVTHVLVHEEYPYGSGICAVTNEKQMYMWGSLTKYSSPTLVHTFINNIISCVKISESFYFLMSNGHVEYFDKNYSIVQLNSTMLFDRIFTVQDEIVLLSNDQKLYFLQQDNSLKLFINESVLDFNVDLIGTASRYCLIVTADKSLFDCTNHYTQFKRGSSSNIEYLTDNVTQIVSSYYDLETGSTSIYVVKSGNLYLNLASANVPWMDVSSNFQDSTKLSTFISSSSYIPYPDAKITTTYQMSYANNTFNSSVAIKRSCDSYNALLVNGSVVSLNEEQKLFDNVLDYDCQSNMHIAFFYNGDIKLYKQRSINKTITIRNEVPKYVCAGQNHMAVLTEKGKIYSTGDNTYGQFGDGTTINNLDTLVPTASSFLKFTSMRCGRSSMTALSDDGNIYLWGSPLGHVDFLRSSVPITVPLQIRALGNAKFSSVSIGNRHLLGVSLDKKKVYMYGKNHKSSFGNSVDEYKELTPIDNIPENRTIIEASAVGFYSYLEMSCSDGQYGDQCEKYNCFGVKSTSNYTCNGKGRCVSPNTCVCFVDYTLSDGKCVTTCYGTNEYSEDVCSGRGECISKDNCICKEGFGGKRCRNNICFGLLSSDSGVCNTHGSCVGPNVCQCESIYFGTRCNIHIVVLIIPPIVAILLIILTIVSPFIIKRIVKFKKDYDSTRMRFKDVEMELLLKNKKLDTIEANYYIDPDHLEFDRRMGGGSYADVFKGTYKGAPVAIKLMKKSIGEEIDEELEKEITILKSSHHPNIVQLVGLAKTSNNMMIVTDFMEGGSLDQYIKSKSKLEISFTKKVKLLADVASGMTRLHSFDPPLVHRDLKPANILIDAGATLAKVCDFGVSNFLQTEDDINYNTGTDGYQPPEVLSGFNSDSSWDVYSFAIVMYEVLHETSAYSHINKFQIHEQVKRGCRPDVDQSKVTTHAHQKYVDLMSLCWSHHSQERPIFEQIGKELRIILNQAHISQSLI